MPMIETSASARPSLRRPIPFTVVTTGKGLCAAAPCSPAPATFWPAALFNPASAAAAAACFRKLRRSISILLHPSWMSSPRRRTPGSRDSPFPFNLRQIDLGILRRLCGTPGIPYDLHPRHGDQSFLHHCVQMRNQLIDLLFCINNAQHNWSILRQRPIAFVTNSGARSVPFNTAINNSAGHSHFLTLGENRFVQRLALPLVILAEMYSQHACFKFFFHCRHPFSTGAPSETVGLSSTSTAR